MAHLAVPHELAATLRAILSIGALLFTLPFLYATFKKTWRTADDEAHRRRVDSEGESDLRPFVALPLCALALTLAVYYGERNVFDAVVRPQLLDWDLRHAHALRFLKYEELYGLGWSVCTYVGGLVFAPIVIWKATFPRDAVRDFGLRARGLFKDLWISFLFLLVVAPVVWLFSFDPTLAYPLYKNASRSWFDLIAWETLAAIQILAIEIFFRGLLLRGLERSIGSAAIFVLGVPYCMLYFGKPYLEVTGAIVVGVALGSLSLRTRTISQGFFIHAVASTAMDVLALRRMHALPQVKWAGGVDVSGATISASSVHLARIASLIWVGIIVLGIVVMLVNGWRAKRELFAVWRSYARDRGLTFTGTPALVEEITEDGLIVAIGVEGHHTCVRTTGLQAVLVRFRVRSRGMSDNGLDGWDKLVIDPDLDTHYDFAASSTEDAHTAMMMVRGDARPELLRMVPHDVSIDYDRGKIKISFLGENPDGAMLDVSRAVTIALARYRAVETF